MGAGNESLDKEEPLGNSVSRIPVSGFQLLSMGLVCKCLRPSENLKEAVVC